MGLMVFGSTPPNMLSCPRQQLKTEASAALREWKKANSDKALDDKPFWMTGEARGHGVMQSDYYRHGFDAMINFDYQEQAAKAVDCFAQMDTTRQQMAEKLQDFNVLSYLSSHDTRLFREGGNKAAELLLLAPGAVQIFMVMNPRVRSAPPVRIHCKARVRI